MLASNLPSVLFYWLGPDLQKLVLRGKRSSLFVQSFNGKGKKLLDINTRGQSYKTFYGRNLRIFSNKSLECLLLPSLSNLV
jgi:hypothetical protein